MTYIEPASVETWDVLTAEQWNQDVVDNTIALNDQIGMLPLTTITVTAALASISFSDIPGTYDTLRLTGTLRSTFAGSYADWLYLRLNGDSGVNYTFLVVGSPGSSSSGSSYVQLGSAFPAAGAPRSANATGSVDITLPQYASGSWWKPVQFHNADGEYMAQMIGGGMWRATSPITSLSIGAGNGLIQAGSIFTLWAMKGA